ncbi:hypothetical protein PM10SUCC1_30170 [Propionigenium maris DSM 9537]|uniref:Uncharacterized protein n=1 Tax=Propionigenium maris DSM 9537 TaxID=1123000 RepID=A0A9W6GLW7_9FUSO|nr:OadG family protein [Propionigenium maris]GLI57503.1 hypothetical protein PM10SUCC1_30170 [Propionigenium maris DSM 9537]
MIFQEQMTFAEGLQLTAIAMGIVFILLFAISLILEMFKHIPQDEQKKASSRPAPTPSAPAVAAAGVDWAELEADEDMMVAALVASMEAAGKNRDTNYKITRIKRL